MYAREICYENLGRVRMCLCALRMRITLLENILQKKRELPHSTREYIVHRKKNKDNFIRISFCTMFVVLFQKHCFFLVFVTI